ncbi:MAG TPA: UbiD family decarboxylase [Candidatus Poseidoniales archaeon]|nr:UbiD family decarboxylase [Candidatus Poseidoniales archaeon]
MAFRDHLDGAVKIESINPINEMRLLIESNPNDVIMFTSVDGAVGHSAAANVCLRDNMVNQFGIQPAELLNTLEWAMNNRSEPLKYQGDAPVLENSIEPVDLGKLPIPHHYPQDRGRYMSASIIIAEHAGLRNVSFHRQFVRDKNHLVARLVPRHLRTMVDEARAQGEKVKIAIVNGADPCLLLAAAMSFNEPIDELTVASSLYQKFYGNAMQVITLENGVTVPADAEYAMCATITSEDDDEGPYIDITGTIDDVRKQPVIEVHSIHHRNNPIFHAILPALGEHHALMGLPRAPTIFSSVSKVCDCRDVVMTSGGSGWLAAVVQIVPQSPDDAKAAIMAAFSGHPSMKSVTIVDTDINPTDPVRVEWALMTRWQPDKDTVILSNQRGSSLDPTRTEDGLTSKIGYDATIPFGSDKKPYTSVL